jgi:uncharacterized phage-like protein YoqJ
VKTSIVNIHRTKKYDVYIGRAGHGLDGYFGNPFRLEDFGGDREACLRVYRAYFYDRLSYDLEFRRKVQALKGKTLGCFCWPDLCHGEVIAEHLDGERLSVVAFTGHRPDKVGGFGHDNPVRDRILRGLLTELRRLRPGHAITGMALGVDTWAAECCLHLGIPFTAAVPFAGQDRMWPAESRRHYAKVLKQAARVEIVCGPEVDINSAMQIRNEWMCDRTDHLLAVHDGSRGGTLTLSNLLS